MIDGFSGNMEDDVKRLRQVADRFEQSLKQGDKGGYFDAEDLEDMFSLYLDGHQLQLAEQVLHTAVRQHPQDDVFRLLRAELLIEQDRCEEAFAVVERYPHPEEAWWAYLRFRILSYLGRFDEAVAQADALLALGQDTDAYLAHVALVLTDCGQPDRAYGYLVRAEQAMPDNPEVLVALGRHALEQGTIGQAGDYADRAIAADPYMFTAWFLKGSVALLQDRYTETLDAFEYAIAINPDDELAWMAKTQTLLVAERRQEAEEAVKYMVTAFPYRKDMIAALQGDLAYVQNDYKRAAALYAKAAELDFVNVDLLWRHADCKLQLHRWKEALRLLETLVKYAPDDIAARNRLTDLYWRMGERKKALAVVRRSIRLKPDDSGLYVYYGSLLLDMGDFTQAYTVFRKAHKLAPDRVETNIMMAVISLERDEPVRALGFLDRATGIDPSARETFCRLSPRGEELLKRVDVLMEIMKKEGGQ